MRVFALPVLMSLPRSHCRLRPIRLDYFYFSSWPLYATCCSFAIVLACLFAFLLLLQFMSTLDKKTKTGHKALRRLRSLCGMTAENFSRLTGIGYGQLVAVEQGRRNLSTADALQISANTGVDPAFNADKNVLGIKAIWGDPYNESSLAYWQKNVIPVLREGMMKLQSSGQRDVFTEVICDNAAEVLAAAQVQGKEIAVVTALQQSILEVCERFGLGHSLAEWKTFSIKFDDARRPTAKERQALEGATYAQTIHLQVKAISGQGVGRTDKKKAALGALGRTKEKKAKPARASTRG